MWWEGLLIWCIHFLKGSVSVSNEHAVEMMPLPDSVTGVYLKGTSGGSGSDDCFLSEATLESSYPPWLSCQDLNELIDTTIMSACWNARPLVADELA